MNNLSKIPGLPPAGNLMYESKKTATLGNVVLLLEVIVGLLVVAAIGGAVWWFRGSSSDRFASAPPPPTAIPEARGPAWRLAVNPWETPEPAAVAQVKETETTPVGGSWDPGYTPKVLTWNSRPQMLVFDELTDEEKAWAEWVESGNIQYVSWQYLQRCELVGVSEASCGVTKYYTASPPREMIFCALTVQRYGGAPAWELLSLYHMENHNNRPPFATSYAGAKGPFQIKDWTFGNFSAYPGGDVQNYCDAAFAASNLIVGSDILAFRNSEAVYVDHFRGSPCPPNPSCQYASGYDRFMWNDHVPEATGAYRLAVQLKDSWFSFWAEP